MQIKCEICVRPYNTGARRPMVFSCGHSICQECVKALPENVCTMDRIPFDNYNLNQAIYDLIRQPSIKPPRDYEKLFKICFVGESSVGKTTLLNSFIGQPAMNSQITIGIDLKFKHEVYKDGKLYKYQLWDTGGQQKFRCITRAHYKSKEGSNVDADIILVTYSLDDPKTLREIERYWLDEVRQHAPDSKVLLVGNKLDLERRTSEINLKKLCEHYKCEEVKVSSLEGLNVEPVWRRICQYLIEEMPNIDENSILVNSQSISLSSRISVPKKQTCC